MRAETQVATPVLSPDFTPAFSARIATLARDGLELARVHLNPVEMGPVSVQLALQGKQVRVDMTAEVAATRQVLEQALPALAGALREAGFVLSGGGVYQSPQDSRGQPQHEPGSSAGSQSGSQAGNASSSFTNSQGGNGTGQPDAAWQGAARERQASQAQIIEVGIDSADHERTPAIRPTSRSSHRLVDTFA